MKRLALAAAISLATLTVAAVLWRFRGAAGLFLLSLAAAATVRPFVEMLEPRIGRGPALAVVYLFGLALVGVFGYVVTHGFLHEIDDAAERLGAAYDRLRARPGISGPVHGFLLGRLPPAAELFRAVGHGRPTLVLDDAMGLTRNVIDLAGGALITIALSAYWNASRESFERLWLSLVPAPQRSRARDVWRGVERAVGAHLRNELAQSALCVLLVALIFNLAHLPTPMLPAFAAGILRVVPFFGIPLAGAGAFLAGAAHGLVPGLLAAATTVLILLSLDRIVARRLFAARHPSPTLVVLLIVALVDAFGLPGLLLASTLATAVQVYAERLIATHPRRARQPHSLLQIEERLERVRERLRHLPESEATQLGSIVTRLATLAAQARRAVAR